MPHGAARWCRGTTEPCDDLKCDWLGDPANASRYKCYLAGATTKTKRNHLPTVIAAIQTQKKNIKKNTHEKKANKKVNQPSERKRDIYENCVSQSETGAGEVNVWEGHPPLHKYHGKAREREERDVEKFSIS